jgi:hypothetical protein
VVGGEVVMVASAVPETVAALNVTGDPLVTVQEGGCFAFAGEAVSEQLRLTVPA